MPSYRLLIEDREGGRAEVGLTGPSLPEVVRRVREQGGEALRVLDRRPDPALGRYWLSVSGEEAALLFRQLAFLLRQGVAISPALAHLARELQNPTLRVLLLDVESQVRQGETLAGACSAYPRLFSPVTLRLLEAGEGDLPEILQHLSRYMEQANQAAHRIRTALVYPQVVGLFTLALMMLTFLFVTPKFLELFQELGVRELPLLTRGLVWFGNIGLPLLVLGTPAAAALLGLGLRRAERRAPFRLEQVRTRIPVIGALYHHFALLRLTRLLAVLLSGGVPLLEALRLAGQGAESPLLQAAMWDAIPHAAAGESLATAFGHAGILPPSYCAQVAAAEAGGDLPGGLTRLAEWYGDQVDYLAARLAAVLEPLFILILAVGAGWIAIGIFAPLVGVIRALTGGE